jgi:hypothetical protein
MFLGGRSATGRCTSAAARRIAGEDCDGGALSEILDDLYVRACGSDSFRRKVVTDPRTIDGLERNVRNAFADLHP